MLCCTRQKKNTRLLPQLLKPKTLEARVHERVAHRRSTASYGWWWCGNARRRANHGRPDERRRNFGNKSELNDSNSLVWGRLRTIALRLVVVRQHTHARAPNTNPQPNDQAACIYMSRNLGDCVQCAPVFPCPCACVFPYTCVFPND